MGRLRAVWRRARALYRHGRMLRRAGLARPDGGSLLVAPLALGTVSLLTGLALTDQPIGLAHICLITGMGLTGSAMVAGLVKHMTRREETGELAYFRAIGDRLEHGLEKLKDLQWELTDNETRYRDLLDSQNDIITRVDTQSRLTFVNRAFCRTLGVEAGAVLGTPFAFDVLQHEGDARDPAEPGRRLRFDELIITAHGPRWFAFEQHAIADESGAVQEIQLLGRDVTEQRRTQEALAEARDQAEAANRAKSRFLAAMSHEIRTPMNGILGMTSLLGETPLTAEQRSYLGAVELSAKNLLTIIDEILDLSKIEAGKLEIHPAPFPLDECVQGIVELMSPRARERQLDLAWRIEPDLPRMVIGDETRIRQILLNLIGNAIKFTDYGGVLVRIRRAAMPADGADDADETGRLMVEIAVADTGVGIAPDKAAALFAEFEQADDVARRKRSGSGLGLAISRRLARAMGGDIVVDSTPGEGSTFTACLALEAEATGAGALPGLGAGDHRRMIIVSSRTLSRALMCEILGSIGVRCLGVEPAAASGVIADAARGGQPFDTVIIDAEAGVDTVGRIALAARACHQRLRTILVVEHPSSGRLEAFREAGCDAYLVRPVRPASLVTQIDLGSHAETIDLDDETVPKAAERTPVKVQRSHSVLLVEDNDINALLARRMSERAGCSVHHAPSGAAAISHCEALLADASATVDIVLMDIHMPEMDGFEASRRIKRLFASRGRMAPPIVALTANAFAEDRRRCFEAGLDDYLAKPFDRSELEALLEKWCAATPSARDGRFAEVAA